MGLAANSGKLWFSLGLASLLLAGAVGSPPLLAQTVTVTTANPNNAPQGTVNLNVLINGNGFKKGAISKFFISGTTDPGGITVNSTAFVSSSQLNANISIANNAAVTDFDIIVVLTNGTTGKGSHLFAVTVPDPAIAFLGSGLEAMNANGTSQYIIFQPPNTKGSQRPAAVYRANWSPDGSQLVFEMLASSSAGTSDGIYVINRDGSGLRKVIALNNGQGLADPVWSPAPAPDGNWKIAFEDEPAGTRETDLFIVNLDGTGLVNLTNTPNRDEYWPTWDPYATRVAAQVWPCQDGSCPAQLHEYNLGLANGAVTVTSEANLTASGPLAGVSIYHPEWAKTQDKIIVDVSEIFWIVSLADPTSPIEVTTTNGVWASWSPDDSKIVFQMSCFKCTMHEMNADGTGLMDLGVNGGQPAWRRCCPTCAVACVPFP